MALNNSETAEDRGHPDLRRQAATSSASTATGRGRLETGSDGRADASPCRPLSAVVYESAGRIPRSKAAPSDHARGAGAGRRVPRPDAGVGRTSAARRSTRSPSTPRPATARGRRSAPTTPRRTGCSTTSARLPPARACSTAPSCWTTRGHTRDQPDGAAAVPAPTLTIEAPGRGQQACAARSRCGDRRPGDGRRTWSRFERSVAGGAWTAIGTDDSSPAYTVFDDLTLAEPGGRNDGRVPGDA